MTCQTPDCENYVDKKGVKTLQSNALSLLLTNQSLKVMSNIQDLRHRVNLLTSKRRIIIKVNNGNPKYEGFYYPESQMGAGEWI